MGALTDQFLDLHEVQVETLQGDGPYGESYDPPVAVRGLLDDTRQLVRSDRGDEVVSESTFYTHLEHRALFTTDSRVTIGTGDTARVANVIRASARDDGGLLNLANLEVALT